MCESELFTLVDTDDTNAHMYIYIHLKESEMRIHNRTKYRYSNT